MGEMRTKRGRKEGMEGRNKIEGKWDRSEFGKGKGMIGWIEEGGNGREKYMKEMGKMG